MARVPDTISLEWLLGQSEESECQPAALHRLSEKEADRFIRQCGAALKSHSGDFERGHDKENALAAFESAMTVLLEVRDKYPGKRADIDAILVRFGYANRLCNESVGYGFRPFIASPWTD